jgi:hypothetical protein
MGFLIWMMACVWTFPKVKWALWNLDRVNHFLFMMLDVCICVCLVSWIFLWILFWIMLFWPILIEAIDLLNKTKFSFQSLKILFTTNNWFPCYNIKQFILEFNTSRLISNLSTHNLEIFFIVTFFLSLIIFYPN